MWVNAVIKLFDNEEHILSSLSDFENQGQTLLCLTCLRVFIAVNKTRLDQWVDSRICEVRDHKKKLK